MAASDAAAATNTPTIRQAYCPRSSVGNWRATVSSVSRRSRSAAAIA
jgi:hypothetical protein